MGCNCSSKTATNNLNNLNKPKTANVALPVIIARRDICRNCEYSTKNTHPKYAAFGGLTNTSKCQKLNELILDVTKSTKLSCPLGKFKEEPSSS